MNWAAVPPGPPQGFARGQWVQHPRFGHGEVVDVADDEISVQFVRGGERRVLASYLQPASRD